MFKQHVDRGALAPEQRQTNAGGAVKPGFTGAQGIRLVERVTHLFRDGLGLLGRRLFVFSQCFENHDEFIAAQTANRIFLTHE